MALFLLTLTVPFAIVFAGAWLLARRGMIPRGLLIPLAITFRAILTGAIGTLAVRAICASLGCSP